MTSFADGLKSGLTILLYSGDCLQFSRASSIDMRSVATEMSARIQHIYYIGSWLIIDWLVIRDLGGFLLYYIPENRLTAYSSLEMSRES